MKPLYGFMQDDRWYEDLGHVLIGLVPMWGWWREHRQWPPGARLMWDDGNYVFPEDRIADSYRDFHRDFMGYALGDAIRTGFLIGVIAGMWWVR